MMRPRWTVHRRRILIASLAFCALALAAAHFAGRTALDGFLWDLAVAARARIVAPPGPGTDVAVIALDAESLDGPEFADLPRVLFAPHWAVLLDGLSDARAIGFDIIFAYSANRLFPDYERGFLTALDRLKSRVVLGRTLLTLPASPYLFAAGALEDDDAVSAVELAVDGDGIVRRTFASVVAADGSALPSFAASVLKRAGTSHREEILLPPRHPELIPTYALADVLRCATADMPRLRAAFANRIVLIGTTLPEEERKTTSARFMPPHAAAGAANHPCDLPHIASTDPGTGAVPGVHVHAAAIEAVWHGFVALPASPGVVRGLTIGAAILGLALGFAFAPLVAAAGAAGLMGGLFAIEISAAVQGTWLPVAIPALTLAGATTYAFAARAVLEGRLNRSIQAAFAQYVSPIVVERLTGEAASPSVGGATCTITIMFADLTGFTALSDGLPPDALLRAANEYLAIMADEVEAGGGYVDKFIGDAVMAIWNAPRPNEEHALSAARTALRIYDKIAAHAASERQAGRPALGLKIALHTGEAIVGNVGSKNRLNFTAVGRTVNIAARLERAGEPFGCPIVLSGATAELVRQNFKLRALGDTQLRGIPRDRGAFRTRPRFAAGLDHPRGRAKQLKAGETVVASYAIAPPDCTAPK